MRLIGGSGYLIGDGGEGLMHDAVGFAMSDLDFNPRLSVSPDRSLPEGILATHEEFLSRARKINPNTALSLQDSFDRAFPYSSVAFVPMNVQDAGLDAVRYTFPEWTMTNMIERSGDYAAVNNGLRYGWVWGMQPRYQTASMEEPLTQPLSRYLAEPIRIRKQYANLLFFGRFNDTSGAQVTGDKDVIRYSVFTPADPSSPQRACVVMNFGEQDQSAQVSLPGKEGRQATIRVPFQPDRVAVLPVKLILPPQRVAVVVTRH